MPKHIHIHRHVQDSEREIVEQVRRGLEAEVKAASSKLKSFPREGAMGLPTEEVRLSAAFREAKNEYAKAFEALRRFNSKHA